MTEYEWIQAQKAAGLTAALNDRDPAGWKPISITRTFDGGYMAIIARDTTAAATEPREASQAAREANLKGRVKYLESRAAWFEDQVAALKDLRAPNPSVAPVGTVSHRVSVLETQVEELVTGFRKSTAKVGQAGQSREVTVAIVREALLRHRSEGRMRDTAADVVVAALEQYGRLK